MHESSSDHAAAGGGEGARAHAQIGGGREPTGRAWLDAAIVHVDADAAPERAEE